MMNREEIKSILPHREPMLLVDELELVEGAARGIYRVRGDEFFLQGHFPGNPVVPGVILCEIMAQACGIMLGDKTAGKTPYYTGIDKVRFRAKAKPGDVLVIHAEIKRSMGNFFFAGGKIEFEDGTLVCSGELSFALVEEKE